MGPSDNNLGLTVTEMEVLVRLAILCPTLIAIYFGCKCDHA